MLGTIQKSARLAAQKIYYAKALSQEGALPPAIVVGTHHKTGTNYANTVFKDIAALFGYRFVRLTSKSRPDDIELRTNTVYMLSQLEPKFIARFEQLGHRHRIIHFIRDPRTLCLSAARYHMTASEDWLDQKHERYGGKSHRQCLEELDHEADRVLFELRNHSGFHTKLMLDCTMSRSTFNVKLEDISSDVTMESHLQMLLALGLRKRALLPALDIASRHSLWAMSAMPAHATRGVKPLPQELIGTDFFKEYQTRFGDAHTDLGYS